MSLDPFSTSASPGAARRSADAHHASASPESWDRFVTSRQGIDLYVQVRGSGPHLVWVAGLGDDHSSFEAQVNRFAGEYTCVTFDNRGTGQSTVPPGPYSIQDYVDDTHDVVTALGIAPVYAIGSSMGGAICQSWALRHPADIKRLVLSNTWAEHDPLLDLLFRHWLALAGSGENQRLAESLLMGCYSGEYFKNHPEVIAQFLGEPLPDMDGLQAAIAACQGHDLLDKLAAIKIPTLVMAAEYDTVVRPQMSARIAERLPAAQLVTVTSGHMIMWEEPEKFANAIKQFFRGESTQGVGKVPAGR